MNFSNLVVKPECICANKEYVYEGTCERKSCNTKWKTVITDNKKIKSKCPEHGVIMRCGDPYYYNVCESCAKEGYYVMAGYGGPPRVMKK